MVQFEVLHYLQLVLEKAATLRFILEAAEGPIFLIKGACKVCRLFWSQILLHIKPVRPLRLLIIVSVVTSKENTDELKSDLRIALSFAFFLEGILLGVVFLTNAPLALGCNSSKRVMRTRHRW